MTFSFIHLTTIMAGAYEQGEGAPLLSFYPHPSVSYVACNSTHIHICTILMYILSFLDFFLFHFSLSDGKNMEP